MFIIHLVQDNEWKKLWKSFEKNEVLGNAKDKVKSKLIISKLKQSLKFYM